MAKGGKEIRKRIRSVKNTQQLTKAMKMVAAARLRKSEGRASASRPYSETLREVTRHLAAVAVELEHPLLEHVAPDVPRVLLLFLTSDKGLCGSYNSNLNRRAAEFVERQRQLGREVDFICAGRKGHSFTRRSGYKIVGDYESFTNRTSFAELKGVADRLTREYLAKQVSEVYLLYARFINVVRNEPTVIRLLPVEAFASDSEDAEEYSESFMLEPSPTELFSLLLPRYFQTVLFQAAIESFTSENGARMVAMDNATTAAGEMIDALTLQYNKARQASITLELLDIVGGAEALKG